MKTLITYSLILLTGVMMLAGCYTERKAVRQTVKAQANYPGKVAELVSVWYPIKELTKDSIVYKKGETLWRFDTVTVDCDSVYQIDMKTGNVEKTRKYVRVPCPPCPNSVDTFLHYRQQVQESTAALQAEKGRSDKLQAEITELLIKIAELQKSLSIAIWAVIILAVYTLARWILLWALKIRLP